MLFRSYTTILEKSNSKYISGSSHFKHIHHRIILCWQNGRCMIENLKGHEIIITTLHNRKNEKHNPLDPVPFMCNEYTLMWTSEVMHDEKTVER